MKELGRILFFLERVDCVGLKSENIKKKIGDSANESYWHHLVCTLAHWYEIIQIFQQYSFYFVASLVFLV